MRSVLTIVVVAVFVSALLVVSLRHQARVLSTQLQTLQVARDALNTEWGKLLLEEGAWSEHRRVESAARQRLDMAIPDSKQIVVIDLRKGATR
ncbi:MAG: cell division protein FtsL [Acidiferrobacterales bacterium]|nr:cell division protein FtsL [Acidiferrobacterales bacterium]